MDDIIELTAVDIAAYILEAQAKWIGLRMRAIELSDFNAEVKAAMQIEGLDNLMAEHFSQAYSNKIDLAES